MIKAFFIIIFAIFLFFIHLDLINAQQAFQKSLPNAPLICGHRGGFDGKLPENSLSRFNRAVKKFKKSTVMLELDVRQNADGELFILHDETLDRTTTGAGAIKNATSSYLKSLYLKNQESAITQERIPTFEEVLNWVQSYKNVYLMVDIKGDCWEKTIQAIQSKRLENQCLILTFSAANTQKVRQLAPNITISALITNQKDWDMIQSFHIPQNHLVAYINKETPVSLIETLKQQCIKITSDVSENVQRHSFPFNKNYYTDFIKNKQLDILISDYPIQVRSFLK